AATDSAKFSVEDINEIFRIMHTIKSSAGIMMYENISVLAHKLEDVFHYLRESYSDDIPYNELADGVLKTADFITGELIKIRSGANVDGSGEEIIHYLDDFLAMIKKDHLPEEEVFQVEHYYVAPKAGEAKKYYHARIYYRHGTEMSNVCAYACIFALSDLAEDIIYKPADITSNDAAGEIMRNGFELQIATLAGRDEIVKLIEQSSGEKEVEIQDSSIEEFYRGFTEINASDLIISLDDDWEEEKQAENLVAGSYVIEKEAGKIISMANVPRRAKQTSEVYQIPIDKINELSELVEWLRVADNKEEMTTLVNDVWHLVSSIKKVQMRSLFQKMDKVVYNISRKIGKIVDFKTEGAEIEIERGKAELISESIIQIIKNALDHGIEEMEERKKAGKNAKGLVALTAGVMEDEIFISIFDDGKGLDIKRIYEVACARNLTDGRELAEYDVKEIYRFIIAPGFSTNRDVTVYSGRGVGLDVVSENISGLNGRLEVDSMPGQWTEMCLWLPNN
ncbi:MAG: ATP-binding protein, partial [Lachnospiraceae bacterium]|nr:ATP-binding protein [Lachnospiraceae bacterium]